MTDNSGKLDESKEENGGSEGKEGKPESRIDNARDGGKDDGRKGVEPGAGNKIFFAIIMLVIAVLVLASIGNYYLMEDKDGGDEEYTGDPKIVISPDEHDFGDIHVGDEVSFDFAVRNDGEGVLEIIKAESDCPCTTVGVGKSSLKPGETTTLKVTYLPDSSEIGPGGKVIFIKSNDPEKEETEVYVLANVSP